MAQSRIVNDPDTGEEIKVTNNPSIIFHDPMVTAEDADGNTGKGYGNKGEESKAERDAIQDMKQNRFGKP